MLLNVLYDINRLRYPESRATDPKIILLVYTFQQLRIFQPLPLHIGFCDCAPSIR